MTTAARTSDPAPTDGLPAQILGTDETTGTSRKLLRSKMDRTCSTNGKEEKFKILVERLKERVH
jgi:hypothetical protein